LSFLFPENITLKDDVKKDSRIKKKKRKKENNKTQKLDKKKDKMRSLHIFFFNNTIDITLPSPNKARDT